MQVRPNTLVDLCLDTVVATLDATSGFQVPELSNHLPLELQTRLVARSGESPTLLAQLIEAGLACQSIDLSNCDKSERLLKLLSSREIASHTVNLTSVTLHGKTVSKKAVLDFTKKCPSLRSVKIHWSPWVNADFLDALSLERPELHELVLLKLPSNSDVVLSKQAAERWKLLKILNLAPYGSIEPDAAQSLFKNGVLEEISCHDLGNNELSQLPVCRPLRVLNAPHTLLSATLLLQILLTNKKIETVLSVCPSARITDEIVEEQLEALEMGTSPIEALSLSVWAWGPDRVARLLACCPNLKKLVLDCSTCSVWEIVQLLHQNHQKGGRLLHLTLWHIEIDDALLHAIETSEAAELSLQSVVDVE